MIFHTTLLLLTTAAINVSAHGYLSSPPPRGIQKEGYQIDDLKSPNNRGLCRGEPEGQITKVKPGQVLRLGLTITAPHIGPCEVSLLDTNLSQVTKPFAEKMNCAAPGGPGYWDIKLPSNVSGRKVLRWYWEGRHISTPGEPYEQCIDLDFGGDVNNYSAPSTAPDNYNAPSTTPDNYSAPSPAPRRKKPASTAPKRKKRKSTRKPKKMKKRAAAPKPRPQPTYDDEEGSFDDYGDEAPHSSPYDAPSSYSPPPSPPKGGKCQHGNYKCTGSAKYAVCNWGQWVSMSCGAGTRCHQTGTFIVCGH